MKNILTHARVTALLCCGAALLLSACGGGSADTPVATASMVESTSAAQTTVAAGTQTRATATANPATASTAQAPRLGDATAPAPATASDQISALYRTMLKRDPSAADLQYWAGVVYGGYPISVLRAALMSSAEYHNLQAAAPATATP
jgi:hypothetical protein